MIRRIYVEKRHGFDVEARSVLSDLKGTYGIKGLEELRILNRYDVSGISDSDFERAKTTIFSEPMADIVYDNDFEYDKEAYILLVEYLPGQYDQRADSAEQCIQIITEMDGSKVKTARVYVLKGKLSDNDIKKIREYFINPVEAMEASLEKLEVLEDLAEIPDSVETLHGFIDFSDKELSELHKNMGLAMSLEDLCFVKDYFKGEKRNPTITEIKLIDTYWSDHCRHTTFNTIIDEVNFEEGSFIEPVKKAYEDYLNIRCELYKGRNKPVTLMDIATIGLKELKKRGLLKDLEESDEINACSIVVEADVNGNKEEWLVMFKNETHNHPTEIEPFGGAATCLGGAIRDPLSGRSYVYQAMRVTGCGDPRQKIEDTLKGKLPQRKITLGAASGYSSYGNQIGLATGFVDEVYDKGYVAKRMEIGAVIGANKRENVIREKPTVGDVIILLGGRTGRDGCGGATGSSKKHTEKSLAQCGAEVQKGNAPTERKIQRFFRNSVVDKMIKKCNDFGAGGVSVAVGELADGLYINLDKVPKKYEGLNGTELAISESQERMAVLIDKKDEEKFISLSLKENLEATKIAVVTEDRRLKMVWKDKTIVDISRDFLDTNGVEQRSKVKISAPKENGYFEKKYGFNNIKEGFIETLKNLNVCSKRGLVERFDGTIGRGSVLMPFGGKNQLTPAEGMAAKLPVLNGDTNTGTLMAYGFNPDIAKWSPFYGALYAVVDSVTRIVAMGGDYKRVRLTFQEYFERLEKDSQRWGKPFSALLGALTAQRNLDIAAIGGKDSMSGSFNDMDVPPTLVSFAVAPVDVNNIISPELKEAGSKLVFLKADKNEDFTPDFNKLKENYNRVLKLIEEGKILSASSVKGGGLCEALSKMSFGNMIGAEIDNLNENLFYPYYGSFLLEVKGEVNVDEEFKGLNFILLGRTIKESEIKINGSVVNIDELVSNWESPLKDVFKINTDIEKANLIKVNYTKGNKIKAAVLNKKPKVFIPVFPGTNCEYDSAHAFDRAGGDSEIFVFRNLNAAMLKDSIKEMADRIKKSQIIMIPGGFSAGDEPDGSGKFIAAVFRNPAIKEAVMDLLYNRDGLILGVCNGFQALIKLGLLPYGKILDLNSDDATLTFNTIGRHMSRIVKTRISSNLSPWFNNVNVGDVFNVPVSHGEGRFMAPKNLIEELISKGQVATQYVDFNGNPSMDIAFNPNGSLNAIEGITSPDGRILGKMGHSERIGENLYKNIKGDFDQKIFESGINYYNI